MPTIGPNVEAYRQEELSELAVLPPTVLDRVPGASMVGLDYGEDARGSGISDRNALAGASPAGMDRAREGPDLFRSGVRALLYRLNLNFTCPPSGLG